MRRKRSDLSHEKPVSLVASKGTLYDNYATTAGKRLNPQTSSIMLNRRYRSSATDEDPQYNTHDGVADENDSTDLMVVNLTNNIVEDSEDMTAKSMLNDILLNNFVSEEKQGGALSSRLLENNKLEESKTSSPKQ